MNQRKFRTQGGGVVEWTYTHDVPAQVGSYTCSGCGTTSRRVQWGVANSHAANCHQIP
ncbi:hypothetical protein ACGFNP_25050 [Nonomuraea sp. NPDC049269]|uniref:hypothetical protein n=1 Tax=Nonomuraea sp. NPDC049269 TaxID=3364349 RepID=UPI00371ED4E7